MCGGWGGGHTRSGWPRENTGWVRQVLLFKKSPKTGSPTRWLPYRRSIGSDSCIRLLGSVPHHHYLGDTPISTAVSVLLELSNKLGLCCCSGLLFPRRSGILSSYVNHFTSNTVQYLVKGGHSRPQRAGPQGCSEGKQPVPGKDWDTGT